MDNYSYGNSYPESGDSSPRSREIDFENTPPWEELPPNYKVKFMCSYGGKIHPRPHDNQLAYIGGETKILAVERNAKFSAFISKLSSISESDVCFKYQLPGEDLDALISVTNDDDLEHMMQEYDRLYRVSPKPARLRLFLFPVNPLSAANSRSFGSDGAASDRERFVDALNSGPVQSSTPPAAMDPPQNIDLLFGLEKGLPQQPQVVAKLQDRIPEPEIPAPNQVDRFAADQIQRQIQEMQRLQIGAQEQELNRRRSDDNLSSGGGGGGYGGDYYVPKYQEKLPPANVPSQVVPPAGYWTEKQVAPAGVYPTSAPAPDQSLYMIQGPGGMYQAQMTRQVTGPPGQQGYYAVQRMAPEVYRDQPPQMYNVVQPPAPAASAVAPPQPTQQLQPPPQQQQQQRVAAYQEAGYGMVRPAAGGGGVGMVEAGYTMAYDNGGGRQVYYNTPGGVVQAPPYQAVSGEMRPGGVLNHEGKVIVKSPQ